MRYIPPSKCLSRQQELANQKPEKEVQLDAAKGSLVVKEVNHQKEIQPDCLGNEIDCSKGVGSWVVVGMWWTISLVEVAVGWKTLGSVDLISKPISVWKQTPTNRTSFSC